MLLGQQPLRGVLRRVDPRIWVALAVAVVVLGSFPFWGGALGARVARSALAGRLGVGVSIASGRAGLSGLTLHDVRIAEEGKATLAAIDPVYGPHQRAL